MSMMVDPVGAMLRQSECRSNNAHAYDKSPQGKWDGIHGMKWGESHIFLSFHSCIGYDGKVGSGDSRSVLWLNPDMSSITRPLVRVFSIRLGWIGDRRVRDPLV